jgi:anaerobic selenocysteine-containing dehydrogenase/Fe-S-cluster-containing dehydrogenase component
MARTFRTVCPRNCYCTCGMLVTLDAGRITRIEGDPDNAATGGHVCLKGISYARRVTSPDRLLHPLKRTSAGAFVRVPWDEAEADIAARLEKLRRDRGPQSVLYYDASGSHGALGRLALAFWRQFGGCTLTHGDLCWPAGLEATRLTYGANLHSHPRHTTASRFILVWGHNPAETNVHQMRLLLEAQDRGATLALVDPRGTDTSDAADVHLRPRPGTDAALALGLARVIVDRGLHDAAFLARHATGVDRFLERLRDYPPDRVAEITGVRAGAIEQLAVDYATTRPALLIAGFGLQRHHRAGQTVRAVSLLPALTGNVGVAGGGWQYANLASHCLADPVLPPASGVDRTIPVSRLGPALGDLRDPPVAAAWVERGNPASQNPRSTLVRDAFARLDLLVVVDQFMTDTARLAHYVLPAKTMFEEEDLVTAYWHPYVQLRARIFDPPAGVRTETAIWRGLCARFGFDTRYYPRDAEDARRILAGMAGPVFERLTAGPVIPDGVADVAFADRRFPTPSGKVEFASAEAMRRWGVDPVPAYQPLGEGHESPLTTTYPLQLLSCKTRERIHSQFGNLDWIREVARPRRLDMHPLDAAERGLREGDWAAVRNARGRLAVQVRLDDGLRPGVVHVPEGRCHDGDPDVNRLTDAGITDMAFGATFYECLVEVEGRARPAAHRAAPRGRPPRRVHGPAPRAPGTGAAPTRRAFVLDLGRCVGCGACVLACRLENDWPSAAPWRRVLALNLRRRPGGPTYFLSVACHHCDRPACVIACPSNAYEQRTDGVVVHHEARCLGCRYCEMACPFGAPAYLEGPRVMAKCHLCHHRLDKGNLPACVVACPTQALQITPAGAGRGEGTAAPSGRPLSRSVPGFSDPAGCRPNLRFIGPGGRRRAALTQALAELVVDRA